MSSCLEECFCSQTPVGIAYEESLRPVVMCPSLLGSKSSSALRDEKTTQTPLFYLFMYCLLLLLYCCCFRKLPRLLFVCFLKLIRKKNRNWTVPLIPMPMPKPVCRTCLNDEWVQYEVCITFWAGVWVWISQLGSSRENWENAVPKKTMDKNT